MGDMTKNLSREEFSCDCGCGFDCCDFNLVNGIQESTDHFSFKKGKALLVHIKGGNRCFESNSNTKGAAKDSKHMDAIAADHYIEEVSPQELYDYYDKKYPSSCGIGLYENRVHLDMRKTRARWSVLD